MQQCGQKLEFPTNSEKENVVDRNFYQQKLADEHQREVSKELATRHLLNESGWNAPSVNRGGWIAWRVVPVTVTIIIVILLNFLR